MAPLGPLERLENYLRRYHKLTLDDVEITESKGYWQIKKPCNGSSRFSSSPDRCRHPIHGTMFNEGPTHHTVQYLDPDGRDSRGRWVSQYRTWRAIRSGSV